MLNEILRYLRNYFVVPGGIYTGCFCVRDGGIALPFLADGQYFRIVGSVFNDGVYQYPAAELADEEFDGAVWALAIPKDVLALSEKISTWAEKNGDAAHGPYQSETYANQYSYTKAADPLTGGAVTWESAFRSELSRWRKL